MQREGSPEKQPQGCAQTAITHENESWRRPEDRLGNVTLIRPAQFV